MVFVNVFLSYVSYACLVYGLRSATISNHLAAVKYFHQVLFHLDWPITNELVIKTLKRVARSHAGHGHQPRIRCPISWATMYSAEHLVSQWGPGGRIFFLGLGMSYFFLTRASEMFAESTNRVHPDHSLRRKDVADFMNERQLQWPFWSLADRVEVRFRASQGDQLRRGARITRTKEDILRKGNQASSLPGVVDVVVELLSCFRTLPSEAPLMAYFSSSGVPVIWTQSHATKALRQLVAAAGANPIDYALHSLRIGGATQLSAGRISSDLLQKEGRWKSDAFKAYVRK